MMRLLVGATRSIAWRSWFITEERPTSCCATGVRCLRSRTSRFSRSVSSARSATRISRSELNGFSMKS